MEAIDVLILVAIGWAIFHRLISAGARTAGAAAKAAMGKGSFSENMDLAFKGMEMLEIRINDTHIDENDNSSQVLKEIVGKGLFPLKHRARIGFITSVFDKTSGELEPVISALEAFQEPNSVVYQHQVEVGEVSPDQGFVSWVRLGVILPDILQPPYSGRRDIVAVLRMIDLSNPPDITHGLHKPDQPGLLWQQSLSFSWSFDEKGYSEAAEHREEALAIALKIGVAVAMADGSLDDKERKTLAQWALRAMKPFSGEKRHALKTLYKDAMIEAYDAQKRGNLSLSGLTQRLNEIGEMNIRYEAIELCFDVMAADGIANEEEIRIIRKIAEALGLNIEEIERMRDQKIIGLDTSVSDHASIEVLLGIETDWSKEQIKKHLRSEFQKWNNRINTLAEGVERDNAQRMLDMIAEARNKYA